MGVELNDLVCVISGAAEGIGFGLVQGFGRRGGRVVAALYDLPAFRDKVKPAFPVALDVTSPASVESAVAAIMERFGRIDVWVNNAGIYPRKPADEMTAEDWESVVGVNLHGTWRCCQAVIPIMKAQGSGVILNVGSITLRTGLPHLAHYIASKGGIVGLTRGLARDLGPLGIRVNGVHLGAVQTETERRLFPDQAAVANRVDERQALPGRQTPESVEPVFAFLASAESRDITGQFITVDRGWTHD
ncbi:MAG: SDR family oxidoreductase [Opitutaceae bacterium]